MADPPISTLTVLLVISFNMILPTIDVLSDLGLIISLVEGGHWRYGVAMASPILANTIFTFASWRRMGGGWSGILVPLQLWPQYLAIRLLLEWWRGREAGDWLEKVEEVVTLEPAVEAFPTMIIITIIMFYKGPFHVPWISGGESCYEHPTSPDCVFIIFGKKTGISQFEYLVLFSWPLSILSSCLGLHKFTYCGPLRFLPAGLLSGFLTAPSLVTLLSILSMMMVKGLALTYILSWPNCHLSLSPVSPSGSCLPFARTTSPHITVPASLSLLLLPPVFHSVLQLWRGLGTTKLVSTFLRFPHLLLLPAASPFLYGPGSRNSQGTIKLSSSGSLSNAIYTGLLLLASVLLLINPDPSHGISFQATAALPIFLSYFASLSFTIFLFSLCSPTPVCCCPSSAPACCCRSPFQLSCSIQPQELILATNESSGGVEMEGIGKTGMEVVNVGGFGGAIGICFLAGPEN